MQIGKQVGAADASAFQLTTHPNVSRLSAEISKKPAARALLSEKELSPTALHFAEEQCRLSIQAQEEDKEVKQADVQSPKKVGTKADEIPVTFYRDRIAQDSSCSFDVMRARDSGEPIQEKVKMALLRKKNEEF